MSSNPLQLRSPSQPAKILISDIDDVPNLAGADFAKLTRKALDSALFQMFELGKLRDVDAQEKALPVRVGSLEVGTIRYRRAEKPAFFPVTVSSEGELIRARDVEMATDRVFDQQAEPGTSAAWIVRGDELIVAKFERDAANFETALERATGIRLGARVPGFAFLPRSIQEQFVHIVVSAGGDLTETIEGLANREPSALLALMDKTIAEHDSAKECAAFCFYDSTAPLVAKNVQVDALKRLATDAVEVRGDLEIEGLADDPKWRERRPLIPQYTAALEQAGLAEALQANEEKVQRAIEELGAD